MTLRAIRQVPDPVLRAVCDPVARFDADLAALVQDMFETMYDAPGRGLAAPQVGETLRLFVMDATWKEGFHDPQAFVNPRIIAASVETFTREEGCLSIPGRAVYVTRPAEVTLGWQDIDGTERAGTFDGFAAACVQHEIDHLDGVLCIDEGRAE